MIVDSEVVSEEADSVVGVSLPSDDSLLVEVVFKSRDPISAARTRSGPEGSLTSN